MDVENVYGVTLFGQIKDASEEDDKVFVKLENMSISTWRDFAILLDLGPLASWLVELPHVLNLVIVAVVTIVNVDVVSVLNHPGSNPRSRHLERILKVTRHEIVSAVKLGPLVLLEIKLP